VTPAMVVALGIVGSTAIEQFMTPKRAPSPPSRVLQLTGAHGLSADIAEREAQIIELVSHGAADVAWTTIMSSAAGRVATIPVMRRALAVLTAAGRLTVSVTFTTAQRIADLLGAHLLTSRVADLICQQAALRLPVLNQPSWVRDGSMARTDRLVEYSALIEGRVEGAPRLVANEGKHWVVTSRLFPPPHGAGVDKPEGQRGSCHNAANFGWHTRGATSRSPGGLPVVQSIGLAHDRHHVDYSQLLTLMGDTALVDGEPHKLAQLAADPELYPLVTDERMPLPMLRHPDVPAF
jgi:hypothetical protein